MWCLDTNIVVVLARVECVTGLLRLFSGWTYCCTALLGHTATWRNVASIWKDDDSDITASDEQLLNSLKLRNWICRQVLISKETSGTPPGTPQNWSELLNSGWENPAGSQWTPCYRFLSPESRGCGGAPAYPALRSVRGRPPWSAHVSAGEEWR